MLRLLEMILLTDNIRRGVASRLATPKLDPALATIEGVCDGIGGLLVWSGPEGEVYLQDGGGVSWIIDVRIL